MRGGLAMADGVQALMPATKVGHIGVCREDDGINEYYCKFPTDITEREVIILDLMLATGRSGAAVISRVKAAGVKSVKFMCVLACNEGISVINAAHPDVGIYCASVDPELNEDLYIVPGIGDGGDRIYGTR
jgi:uracil phosphoribosyltransferase